MYIKNKNIKVFLDASNTKFAETICRWSDEQIPFSAANPQKYCSENVPAGQI